MAGTSNPVLEEPAYPDELSMPRSRRDLGIALALVVFGLYDLWQSLGPFEGCSFAPVGCSSPIQVVFLWLQLLSGPALIVGGIFVYVRSPKD